MPELREIIRVIREVTGQAHKAQICAECGRVINRHKAHGRVFRVVVTNGSGQESARHACGRCVVRFNRRRLRTMEARQQMNIHEAAMIAAEIDRLRTKLHIEPPYRPATVIRGKQDLGVELL